MVSFACGNSGLIHLERRATMCVRIRLGRKEYQLLRLNDWQSPCNYSYTSWYPVCFLLPAANLDTSCVFVFAFFPSHWSRERVIEKVFWFTLLPVQTTMSFVAFVHRRSFKTEGRETLWQIRPPCCFLLSWSPPVPVEDPWSLSLTPAPCSASIRFSVHDWKFPPAMLLRVFVLLWARSAKRGPTGGAPGGEVGMADSGASTLLPLSQSKKTKRHHGGSVPKHRQRVFMNWILQNTLAVRWWPKKTSLNSRVMWRPRAWDWFPFGFRYLIQVRLTESSLMKDLKKEHIVDLEKLINNWQPCMAFSC